MKNLYPSHYTELKASGISDAIIERYFFSIEGEAAQQWLIEDAISELGGHAQQYATAPVRKLIKLSNHIMAGGWGCEANGQIKPDEPRQAFKKNSDGQWVEVFSEGGSPKLIKYESVRERPYQGAYVSVMQPTEQPRDTTVICEGAKKGGAVATIGYTAIPLPGVDMAAATGTDELIPAIDGLPRDADIVIAFDSDEAPATIEGVARSTSRLIRLLKLAGFTSVRVASWDAKAGKGIDDVLVAKGADFVHSIIANAGSSAQWQSRRMAKSLRDSKPGFYGLTDPNRKIINQRYIDLHLPAPGSILGACGAMETGKTVAGGKLKDEFFAKHPDGLLELQGYRNGLGQQTAGKWGMDHIGFLEASSPGISQMLIDDAESLAYCLDSLNRRARAINGAIAQGRKVCTFLDEADAVLKHVLGGGTLGKRQAEIWKLWCEILAAVIGGGGYIILAEANLSQLAVDAIAEISGGKVETIENTYQPRQGRKVYDYSAFNKKGKHSDQLLSKACLAKVRKLADDGPVFLASDAQGFAEKAEAALMADGFSVLRVDGDTIDRPETRAFLESPDSYIAEHQPDVVIATTTAESGVSISGGYFENVVLYGSHLEDRALGQLSGRVRGDVPLHLFVKRRVASFGDDPDSFSVDGILKEWQANAFDSYAAADISQYFDAELLRAAGERSNGADGERFHRLKATYQARANISKFSLHYGVISILEAMGCEISHDALQPSAFSKDDKDSWENAGELITERKTDEFVEAECDQKVSWAIRVESSASSTRADRTKAKKILLDASYPGLPFDDQEFVREEIIKGRGDGLRAHTFAWLCQNPKIAKIIDLQSWKTQLEQQFIVLPALRKESARVKVLAQSALADVAKLESYEEVTPLIIAVASWAKERAKTLGRLFRLQIKEGQTNIAVVNKLLRKIGYKSAAVSRPGSRHERRQVWAAEAEPYQAEVWAALEQKWASELMAETIEIEQPSAPVSLICIKERTLIQINDTDSKAPVNRCGGRGAAVDFSRFNLADLVKRFGNFENLLKQAPKPEIQKISAVILGQFADV